LTPYPPFSAYLSSDTLRESSVCFTGQIIDTTNLLTGTRDTLNTPIPVAFADLNKYFIKPGQEFVHVLSEIRDWTWRFMDSVTIVKLDTSTLNFDICAPSDSGEIYDRNSMYNRITFSDFYQFDTVQFIYVPQTLSFEIGDYIKGVNYQAHIVSFLEYLETITEDGDTLLHMSNFDVSFRGEFEISDQPIPLHSNPIQQQHTPKFHTITNQQLLLQNPTQSTAKYTLINAQGKTLFQQRLNPGMEESIPMKSAQVLWLRVESEQGIDVSVVRGF